MKRYISKFLKSVAMIYMTFPIGYVVVAALLYNIPAGQCVRLLLSPVYYIISAIAVMAGYGLWEMRRWSWYVFIVANVLITYGNALVVNEYSESHHKVFAFLTATLFVVGIVVRVAREIRVPYFFPKIRWWESDPRYRLSVPAAIGKAGGESIPAEIMDISMGGCFVKIRSDVREDELVSIEFQAFGQKIHCNGIIVWRTQSTVTHPRGIGIKFASLGKQERHALKMVTRRLKKISIFYRKSRYLLNQDEFLSQLEKLESTHIE